MGRSAPPMPVPSPITISLALTVVEVTATLAFAASGLIAAARKHLDPVGVCVVAGISAFGGGTLRDVLLDRRPFFWVTQWEWLLVVLAGCALAMTFLRSRHFALTERASQWPDAAGLGLFAAGGTQVALEHAMPAIVAVIMGVITAVFGGVLRDIVCNEVPTAFRDHRPYAVCAFAGSWIVVAATTLAMQPWVGLALGALVTFGLRAWALASGYRLPAWQHGVQREDHGKSGG